MGKMLKNTKRGIFILLVMLCVTFAFVLGCGNIDVPSGIGGDEPGTVTPDDPPDGTRLATVVQSSVTFEETSASLVVTWDEVPNATSYRLRITKGTSTVGFSTTVETNTVDLHALEGFKVPENGSISIAITARGSGYTDSLPLTITYELEGTLLLSPQIISFSNGVIEWKKDSAATSYTVKVNGSAQTVDGNTFDVSKLSENSRIDITAKIKGRDSAATSVMYNASSKKLTIMPVTEYTVEGDILKWSEVGGAIGYKLVDLDFHHTTVTTPYYLMTIRNLLYGVYPVMAEDSVVGSAEVTPVDIPYLSGSGTAADPYLIKTPYDLRAVDYYELKYTETAKTEKNNYKIVNNINYNTVSALEGDSNMFTLRKPFFGTLDGGDNTLSNTYVNYDKGFWSLFEYIAPGATVKNIKFDNAEINNSVQDLEHPTNPASAMVAYENYGTVSEVTLSNSKITVTAGGAAGLVIHNYGTVSGCTVKKCNIIEGDTSEIGGASYEMAGVVLHNYGKVEKNTVTTLSISGKANNIGSSAGVVSINRKGGVVKDNSFDGVSIKNLKNTKEAGGVVAYCANGGTVSKGSGELGTLNVRNSNVTAETGSGSVIIGKLYGKKD